MINKEWRQLHSSEGAPISYLVRVFKKDNDKFIFNDKYFKILDKHISWEDIKFFIDIEENALCLKQENDILVIIARIKEVKND